MALGDRGFLESEADTPSEDICSESGSDGFSTDVSDRARVRAQGGNLQELVWDAGYSTDASDSRWRKGKRLIKSNPDAAQRHGLGASPNERFVTAPHGALLNNRHNVCHGSAV